MENSGITPASGRVIIDFNKEWKFQRENDSPEMKDASFDDSKWKTLNVPHDWAVEGHIKDKEQKFDVPVLKIVEGKWLFDKGDGMEKKEPGYDDSKWQEVTLPDSWENHSDYKEDNVYGWFRRKIRAPKGNEGKDIVLDVGCIDDVDETFFNGELIGKSGMTHPYYATAWNVHRLYRVPAKLIKYGQDNIAAVRVFDGTGPGGMRAKEAVNLVEGPFDMATNGGSANGFLPGGIGWYRKEFEIPAALKGKIISVEFDGVYMDSTMWINGEILGNHPYGYTGFSYDLTPHLKYGEKNIIAARLNVLQQCTRWYSGAGIYRNVRLVAVNPVHVQKWGTYITTPDVSENEAKVKIETRVENSGEEAEITLETVITDKNNSICVKNESKEKISGKNVKIFKCGLKIEKPFIWSMENPDQYTVTSRVMAGGVEQDRYVSKFGIRTVKFTKDNGFFLNNKKVPLKGVCLHHDNGYLGTAVHKRAIQRQLEIMKEMGVNAIRTSHNPPDPSLLDFCDSMGLLVMDEAFDEWKENKVTHGYGRFYDDWAEKDLVSMIHRDRNHPSIIIWSIGNEVAEQWAGKPEDAEARTKFLSDIAHREDPSREITAACNNVNDAINKNMAKHLDVFGINYSPWAYKKEKGKWKLAATETSSTTSTRGAYKLEEKEDGKLVPSGLFDTQCSSYDNFATQWATIAWESINAVEESPWNAGEFIWTGFDYIGEPTPYWWPAVLSYFGAADLCGFPKDRYYLYQSRWSVKPMVHLLPHWNWEQLKGKRIPVYVYTNCDSAELFLNGKSLGEKKMSDSKNLRLEWEVPFKAGTIKAVAKKNGVETCSDEKRTAGKPYKIELTADRGEISADGRDLSYITVRIIDSKGNFCPLADNEVVFEIEGSGIIAATGNGNPLNHAFFTEKKCKAFNGMLLCIVKAGEKPSHLVLSATAKGLEGGEVTISTR